VTGLALGLALGVLGLVLALTRDGPLGVTSAAPPRAAGDVQPPREVRPAPEVQAPVVEPSDAPEVDSDDVGRLRRRDLLFPVAPFDRRTLQDTFGDARGATRHEAIDIPAPRGTPVAAVAEGPVAKLFNSVRGGLTVYQFDRDQVYCYYYAHLDRYADGLAEGQLLKRGDLVGYVGTSGNAPRDTPHLHFAIFKLGEEKRWWEGVPVNPFPVWSDAP
jgi:murein DD-endopeptidase MepM/ murein hydrolase activator NlpD